MLDQVDAIFTIREPLLTELKTGNFQSVPNLEELAQLLVQKVIADIYAEISRLDGVKEIYVGQVYLDNLFSTILAGLKNFAENLCDNKLTNLENILRVRLEL